MGGRNARGREGAEQRRASFQSSGSIPINQLLLSTQSHFLSVVWEGCSKKLEPELPRSPTKRALCLYGFQLQQPEQLTLI